MKFSTEQVSSAPLSLTPLDIHTKEILLPAALWAIIKPHWLVSMFVLSHVRITIGIGMRIGGMLPSLDDGGLVIRSLTTALIFIMVTISIIKPHRLVSIFVLSNVHVTISIGMRIGRMLPSLNGGRLSSSVFRIIIIIMGIDIFLG